MMRWLGLTPLLCLLAACNVASVQEAPNTIVHNQCESAGDCPGGACVAKQCRSSTTALQSMLFEVTPPADGTAIAGMQFLVPNDHMDQGDSEASLVLGSISPVTGKVLAEGRKCVPKFVGELGIAAKADDLSVPARVSLTPSSAALGLYSPRTVVQSNLIGDSYWGFSATIAPGTYDVYVEPRPQPDQLCPVPPQVLRSLDLQRGTLKISLPAPSLFEFHVTWPAGDGKLDGWTVDMLDPASGLVISNRVPLALGAGGKTDYVANLTYSPVLVAGKPSTGQRDQLLRLSPPEGSPERVALPTVMMARSALGLFSAVRGTFSNFSFLPTPVHVHGQVTSRNTPIPVGATVTLVATKITDIDSGVLASFVRTANVGDDGQFDVHLLPGTYRVSTVPKATLDASRGNATPLAADARDWIVPKTPEEQAGKVIELGDALPVTGEAYDATDHSPVATAQVQAVASPLSIRASALQQSLTGAPMVPRSSAGEVGDRGEFSLKTDPGTFDISVRPDPNTGFAWLVLPNVAVTSSSSGVSLGRINMPLPFSYGGTVTESDTGRAVPGALIRAFIYLKGGAYTDDVSVADSVLQVAETRAGKEGLFDLLIPAELNRLPE